MYKRQESLFVYDSLCDIDAISSLINPYGKLLDYRPALIEAKAFRYLTFPFVTDINALMKPQKPFNVFGLLLNISMNPKGWEAIDSYYGCSLSAVGRIRTNDIFERRKICATKIAFKTIDDFLIQRFDSLDSEECFAYYGNLNNPAIKKLILRRKFRTGVVSKEFIELFK
jgi:hypothetical protein